MISNKLKGRKNHHYKYTCDNIEKIFLTKQSTILDMTALYTVMAQRYKNIE